VDRRAVESSEKYIRRRHILSTAGAIHAEGAIRPAGRFRYDSQAATGRYRL
jgi:hypothetical protein